MSKFGTEILLLGYHRVWYVDSKGKIHLRKVIGTSKLLCTGLYVPWVILALSYRQTTSLSLIHPDKMLWSDIVERKICPVLNSHIIDVD